MSDLNSIQPVSPIKIPEIPSIDSISPTKLDVPQGTPKFGKILAGYIDDVSKLQHGANESLQKLATGEIKDVHQVMVAMNEAGVAFKLMMEIRNKLVQAYKEIIKTPV
ncbi:flagellar hook-basal body complex protein FliE [bacterium]|nr:flagellar hook-basal body complex protein FliE [bacterium]MCP5463101.1 flagellar hook-basal body complex protein FliE [bacterium]